METIQDRIKSLRTSLGLSQAEFGEKIGLGKTAVSKFEVGTNRVSDPIVYNVSKEWLLSGSGSMFVSDLEDPVARFAADQNLSPLAQAFITKLVSLTDDELRAVYEFMEGLVDAVRATSAAHPAPDPERPEEWTDDQYRTALEEQLALEKKPRDVSEAS